MSEKTYYEEAGKGSHKRPRAVEKETFDANWDAIFSKKEKQDSSANSNDNTNSED